MKISPCLTSTQVFWIPKYFYILLNMVSSNDSEWSNKRILKNKLIIDKIISVSVEVDMIDSNFFEIYEIGLRNKIVDNRKI